jgi:tRNA A37 threonylcarbamoyladenosine modification protein TsaB
MAHDLRWYSGRVGIVMDAQRSQVYYAEYEAVRGKTRAVGKPSLCFPADLARALGKRRILLLGDGAELYRHELGIRRGGVRNLARADLFLSAAVGRLAQVRSRGWKRGEYLTAEPLYIRPPDALRKRDAAN